MNEVRPKILITGSKGLIGGILTKELERGFDVYGIDIQGNKSQRIFKTDISNLGKLRNVFAGIFPLDYIIHLAGDSEVKADWPSVLKNNIIGTKNIYELAREYKVKKMIFASSNHVTGGYEGIPPKLHKEQNPKIISIKDSIRPDSDYGTSKVFGESLARQYFELYGISSICLRIGSVLKDDNPAQDERFIKTWLSHRDLVQLVEKSILSDIGFGIYYGVSNNKGKFWDISSAEKEIGYNPKDNASDKINILK